MILDTNSQEKLDLTADLLRKVSDAGLDPTEVKPLYEKASKLYGM